MFKKVKEKVDMVTDDLTSTMTKIQTAVDESGKAVKIILAIGTAIYAVNLAVNIASIFCKKNHIVYIFNVYEK